MARCKAVGCKKNHVHHKCYMCQSKDSDHMAIKCPHAIRTNELQPNTYKLEKCKDCSNLGFPSKKSWHKFTPVIQGKPFWKCQRCN